MSVTLNNNSVLGMLNFCKGEKKLTKRMDSWKDLRASKARKRSIWPVEGTAGTPLTFSAAMKPRQCRRPSRQNHVGVVALLAGAKLVGY